MDEVEEFLTGARHRVEPDTVLATVLYARVVKPEEHAKRLGKDWDEMLRRFRAYVAKEIEWFRGREVDMNGDRPLAIFDGPARAIRAAIAITAYAAKLDIVMRAGLHTGECDISDGRVSGSAPELCLQIANQAGPGEVIVSNTVKDLVAGSGIQFEAKGGRAGEHELFVVQR